MGGIRSRIGYEVREARRRRATHSAGPLVFLHIGKTGGTAIKNALRPCGYRSPYAIDLRRHDTTMMDVPAGTPFFFAIRDPIDRFASGFNSRQRRGAPRLNLPWSDDEAIAFARFSSANELAEAIGTPEAEHAMHSINHVRASYWHWFKDEDTFLSREGDIFGILRQAELTADFEELATRLGLAGRAVLPTDVRHAHRDPGLLDRSLSALAVENLTQWYARDFDFIRLCTDVHARLTA